MNSMFSISHHPPSPPQNYTHFPAIAILLNNIDFVLFILFYAFASIQLEINIAKPELYCFAI